VARCLPGCGYGLGQLAVDGGLVKGYCPHIGDDGPQPFCEYLRCRGVGQPPDFHADPDLGRSIRRSGRAGPQPFPRRTRADFQQFMGSRVAVDQERGVDQLVDRGVLAGEFCRDGVDQIRQVFGDHRHDAGVQFVQDSDGGLSGRPAGSQFQMMGGPGMEGFWGVVVQVLGCYVGIVCGEKIRVR
jgi:hypothetical protein